MTKPAAIRIDQVKTRRSRRSQLRADMKAPIYRAPTQINVAEPTKPAPFWLSVPVLAVYALVMAFAVWKFAAWILPIVGGWK